MKIPFLRWNYHKTASIKILQYRFLDPVQITIIGAQILRKNREMCMSRVGIVCLLLTPIRINRSARGICYAWSMIVKMTKKHRCSFIKLIFHLNSRYVDRESSHCCYQQILPLILIAWLPHVAWRTAIRQNEWEEGVFGHQILVDGKGMPTD